MGSFNTIQEAAAGGGGDWQDDLGIGAELDGVMSLKTQGSAPSATADYLTLAAVEYGNDANTKLLLHFDGSDDGTDFTDSSASPHTPAPTNAVTKTAIRRFGTASGFFDNPDGTRDTYLAVPNHADFQFGSGDFTIEAWVYLIDEGDGTNTTQEIFNQSHANDDAENNGAMHFNIINSSSPAWALNFNIYRPSGAEVDLTDTVVFPLNIWQHVAISREGSAYRLFRNGELRAEAGDTAAIDVYGGDVFISKRAYSNSYGYWNGYIDELVVTKGEAKYTAPFTPARSAYPITQLVVVDDNGGVYKLGQDW